MTKQQIEQPLIEDLSAHFEDLYNLNNKDELIDMSNLESNVYIPLLDDPITDYGINAARKSMKKAGYDFALSTLDIILNVLSPVILVLLDIMFYVSYPASMAISLLTAIPKKGNLKCCGNYHGIQMLPTVGVLFDRIIANKLSNWIGVHDEQTAFQKGKSTILQLFTIRVLIETARITYKTIYIGFFDLEKAFDKVSRLMLLKKLISLGIGNRMLQARILRNKMCTEHGR